MTKPYSLYECSSDTDNAQEKRPQRLTSIKNHLEHWNEGMRKRVRERGEREQIVTEDVLHNEM